jgi:hypothetical protein
MVRHTEGVDVSDVYEPWQRLVRIVVLGKVLEVPEQNLLLRQLQYVSEDVGMGRYCWNAECRYCEVSYQRPGDPTEHAGLACRLRGFDGMRLTKLAPEVRYNMSEALSRAPREEDTPVPDAGATRPPE